MTCQHSEHAPPARRHPGIYVHRCPGCGAKRTEWVVESLAPVAPAPWRRTVPMPVPVIPAHPEPPVIGRTALVAVAAYALVALAVLLLAALASCALRGGRNGSCPSLGGHLSAGGPPTSTGTCAPPPPTRDR